MDILLLEEPGERAPLLAERLVTAGCRVLARLEGVPELEEALGQQAADIIVLDLRSPDRALVEEVGALARIHALPVAVFVEETDAMNAYERGDYGLAIQHCTNAINSGGLSDDELGIAFYNRGVAYGRKGLYDEAIRDYGQAIRLDPDYAEAFNSRGVAYDRKGLYDEAIRDYGEAIRLDPDYAEAFNNRGIAYSDKRLYDEALRDFSEAMRLRPAMLTVPSRSAERASIKATSQAPHGI